MGNWYYLLVDRERIELGTFIPLNMSCKIWQMNIKQIKKNQHSDDLFIKSCYILDDFLNKLS